MADSATKSISFLCYSDIHHHEYQNGITGEDVERIEEQFYQAVRELKVDFWINCGDRFLSRNPHDISRLRADRALKRLNDLDIPGFIIPGNHDQWTKNPYGGHSLRYVEIYPHDLQNVHVFDQSGPYEFAVRGTPVCIWGVPSGQEVPAFPNTIHSKDFHICAFHGMVRGSLFQNGMEAPEGLDAHSLDHPVLDFVVGGDNHRHQRLTGFSHTMAYYVGAPMQHNWGDAGAERGFLYVSIERGGSEYPTRYTVRHIKTDHPKFVKCETRINDIQELLPMIMNFKEEWRGNVVSLVLTGPQVALKDVTPSEWAKKIKDATGARSVVVKLHYDFDRTVDPEPRIKTEAEEWKDYLKNYGVTQLKDNIDPEKLEKLGLEFIDA